MIYFCFILSTTFLLLTVIQEQKGEEQSGEERTPSTRNLLRRTPVSLHTALFS
jgi:hypothetical protein